MTQHFGPDRRVTLLPSGMPEFLRKRAAEAMGLFMAVAGALQALALASYHPSDPSWSMATTRAPENLIGFPGAAIADVLLQVFGLSAGLLPLLFFAWAWRLFSHRGLPQLWWNLTAVPFALLLASAAVASWPQPNGWPLNDGLGGWIGDELLGGFLQLGAQVVPFATFWAWQLVLVVLAGATFVSSLGLSTYEWRGILFGVCRLVFVIVRIALRPARAAIKMVFSGSPYERVAPRFGGTELVSRADLPLRATPACAPDPSDAPPKRVARRQPKLKISKRAEAERQRTLDLGVNGAFRLPELSHLQALPLGLRRVSLNEFALEQNARFLETVLGEFGVKGEIAEVNPGPVVTRYELDPAPGTKTSRVIGLADDIARSMSAMSARVAVIPGQNRIGIELPNAEREMVLLRELLSTPDYENTAAQLTLALGKSIAGEPVVADLARMPHLLIAGTTGSGKSVAVNTMILSLLYRLSPEKCRMIMIDPKMLELSVYDGIPHLLAPVVTEPGKAVVALKWVVREMQNRYRAMSRLGVRNLAGYNQRVAEARAKGETPKRIVQTGYHPETGEPVYEHQELDLEPMPFIVVVVDEMADLMLVAGKEVEAAIQRLSQMARAAGIHLIMATQRPSVDVITGTIKANFPTRVSFQVTSKIDSRTILGEQGAEQLLGQGDMLFLEAGGKIQRVHGPFVSESEVELVVQDLKKQGVPKYVEEVTIEPETETHAPSRRGEGDELYDEAIALVLREQRASTSFVQRHLQVGYNRAARMIERMEAEGIVSIPDRVGKREVLSGNNG